ncbi:unnamed protein product [Rotaria magnacalcarata]|uniref:Uncharacterized protein n=3 Tax=Rotaria magnacalcarata TaxID=392030 RepID=A0A816TV58_9BILA|nr:unnamed protein product [Rotaria magnacalcarata]CAF2137997.1 unnamed protein product [Rotaria magnacalcarata]CAF4200901.1 unnamed protein product [Rotaria magnacalcarata]CAF4542954.1 unnamed protein product [Rotaria magnacalcarata]
MRNELIGRIGLTHWASLDDIIIEAQKVEEILYRRNKEQRRPAYMKQVAPQDDISYHNTRINGDNINQVAFAQTSKRGEPTKSRTLPRQGIMNYADKHSELCEVIDKKIRLHSQIFVYPRFTESEERRSRLDQSVIQRQNEDQREIKNIMLPIKIEQETSCDQQSKVTTDLDEECDANGFWPVGTESWYIHEIKPQREAFSRSTVPDSIITAQQTSMESQSERTGGVKSRNRPPVGIGIFSTKIIKNDAKNCFIAKSVQYTICFAGTDSSNFNIQHEDLTLCYVLNTPNIHRLFNF